MGPVETSFITISDLLTPVNSVGKAYPGVEIVLGDQPDTPVSLGETGKGLGSVALFIFKICW